MHEVLEPDRTWFHTMALLSPDHLGGLPSLRPARADHRGNHGGSYGDGSYRTCAIKVLERHGRAAATIEWRDSTACSYGEQIWRRCTARRRSICALSGQLIMKGDAVYRPRLVQPPPRNIEAMILASVMEAIPSDGVA
jgi:hypothetical protein